MSNTDPALNPEALENAIQEIFAVKPNLGSVVHLSSPGYQPGKKTRSIRDSATLCNTSVARAEKVPLAEALSWPNPAPAALLQPERPWSWCRVCVGHAVAMVGMSTEVLVTVLARAEVSA